MPPARQLSARRPRGRHSFQRRALTARPRYGTVSAMSKIELAPLSERLEEDELKILNRLLSQAGAKFENPDESTTQTVASRLSEDALTEFLDRLDAHDMAAEIYIPVEYDGRLTVGDYRVGSTLRLQEVLEEMKDELDVEDDADRDEDEDEEAEDDDEEENEGTVIEAQLRSIWQLLFDACGESIEKNVPIHLRV